MRESSSSLHRVESIIGTFAHPYYTRRADAAQWARQGVAAVFEDRLVAADPDRRVVVAKARETLGGESAFLFHQPNRRESQ
jgi:hypothetical protein